MSESDNKAHLAALAAELETLRTAIGVVDRLSQTRMQSAERVADEAEQLSKARHEAHQASIGELFITLANLGRKLREVDMAVKRMSVTVEGIGARLDELNNEGEGWKA